MPQHLPFGFSSNAADVLSGINLTGKTMIVTGGASGIGIETVKSLAAAGASVTIAARRLDAAEEVAQSLKEETANALIDVRPLDLSDLNSVRRFVKNWDKPVHALINNAGIMALPELQRSAEGCEMQFATNFLGHFALTLGLRRHLAKAEGARVVSVSSTGSLFAPVFWDDPHFRFIPYNPLLAYGQSKTGCILMSVGIRDRWASDGIVSNALNPGAIATNLQRHTGGLRTPEEFRKTPEQGAATSVLLAASPLLEGVNGDISTTARRRRWWRDGRMAGLKAWLAMRWAAPMRTDFGRWPRRSSENRNERGSACWLHRSRRSERSDGRSDRRTVCTSCVGPARYILCGSRRRAA